MKTKSTVFLSTVALPLACALIALAGCQPKAADKSASKSPAVQKFAKPAADKTEDAPKGDTKVEATVADTVYTNGKIYTVNEKQPWAEAVAIKDGKFIQVGSADAVKALIGDDTEVVDLGGNMVMPGILDLHSHPFITPWYGQMNLSLKNPGDPKKILEEVKAYADANPDKEWILAGQWNIGIYPDNAPKKEWLDEIVPDRPVVLLDQSGHSSWLNSKALELAGINKDTPTSNLIVIVKDETTGEPTGTIREQALQLAERVIPQATPEQYGKPIEEIFDMFLSYGITTQQSAEGHRAPLEALQLLEREGRLKQRVFVSWDWKTTLNLAYTLDDIEGQIKDRAKYESEMVRPNYVKIFSDGSPGDRTSLLLTHYVGEPDFLGQANMSTEEFAEAFIKFDKMGVGVHVHSIGEGSIRRVVDALEKMKEANGDSGVRHKIAHCWMITPELGSIEEGKFADMIVLDQNLFDLEEANRVDRIGDTHVLKSIVGGKVVYDAMARAGDDKEAATEVKTDTVYTNGKIYTVNERQPWSEAVAIETGKWVDLVVLNQNLLELPASEIHKTQVVKTVFKGIEVFDAAIHKERVADIETEKIWELLEAFQCRCRSPYRSPK